MTRQSKHIHHKFYDKEARTRQTSVATSGDPLVVKTGAIGKTHSVADEKYKICNEQQSVQSETKSYLRNQNGIN